MSDTGTATVESLKAKHAKFVAEYLRTYNRYPSPKFLIGESYGSIRAAGLAQELQSRHGIELNGVALLSALLTYQTLSPAPNNDVAWAAMVQTYAATAWYHKKLPSDLQRKPIADVVAEAKAFAFGDYMLALTRGNTLAEAERAATAASLARFTGLSPEFILRANLRVDSGRYRKELLRDKRLVVGRLDSRFTALDADAAGERQEFDPSNTALAGPYVAMFRDYVRNTLKWESDLHYPTSGNVRPWTYVQNAYMDMTEPLRQAMAKNPYLKVRVEAGLLDQPGSQCVVAAGGDERCAFSDRALQERAERSGRRIAGNRGQQAFEVDDVRGGHEFVASFRSSVSSRSNRIGFGVFEPPG